MDGKELMLNNWVLYKGEPILVTMIGEYGIQSATKDRTVNAKFEFDIEPIPLTPKIMAKVKEAEAKRDDKYQISIDAVSRIVSFKDGAFLEVDGEYSDLEVGEPIEYLHQLQNLYQSLTRKPLQITL